MAITLLSVTNCPGINRETASDWHRESSVGQGEGRDLQSTGEGFKCESREFVCKNS